MGILEGLVKQPDSFYKKKEYSFEKVLGQGSFGEVKQATWKREDGVRLEVAVKVIRKKQLKGDMKAVLGEVDMLKELDHPNIGELAPCWRTREEEGAELRCLQSSSTTRLRAGRSSSLSSSSRAEESSSIVSRPRASSPKLTPLRWCGACWCVRVWEEGDDADELRVHRKASGTFMVRVASCGRTWRLTNCFWRSSWRRAPRPQAREPALVRLLLLCRPKELES
mgnify:FL=1